MSDSREELDEIHEIKRKMGELAKELGEKLNKLPEDAIREVEGSLRVDGEKFELAMGISRIELGPRRIRTVTADRLMHSEDNMT